jgi:hypothetical protein
MLRALAADQQGVLIEGTDKGRVPGKLGSIRKRVPYAFLSRTMDSIADALNNAYSETNPSFLQMQAGQRSPQQR